MVLVTSYPNFLEASCCNVDVVNGGAGFLNVGFTSKFSTLKSAPLILSKNALASASVLKRLDNSAFSDLPALFLNIAVMRYSLLLVKSLISLSRSTTNLTATD